MSDILLTILGIIILVIVLFDFFYTTLSGAGAFYITKIVAAMTQRLTLILSRFSGRKIFKYSGMIINLMVLAVWVILIWLGLFMVYSGDPESITDSHGIVATDVERLYYTGYVLSTLGVGDFTPSSPSFRILTSIFSFFGFIFFTTTMTYLISVFSSVMHKRTLSLSIHEMGKDPVELINKLFEQDHVYTYNQINQLQQMINKHSVNHQAYPVLHYYVNSDKESSWSIHITILDEAINILKSSQKEYSFIRELISLQNSIDHYLEHVKERFGYSPKKNRPPEINWQDLSLRPEVPINNFRVPDDLPERRKVFDSLIKSEGFRWKDVYPSLEVKDKVKQD